MSVASLLMWIGAIGLVVAAFWKYYEGRSWKNIGQTVSIAVMFAALAIVFA